MRPLLILAALAALLLSAVPASATTQNFTNTESIAIPGSGTTGPASPYPSTVSVSGMTGPIADVNVNLRRVSHGRPVEINLVLVSPHGTKVLIMGGNCFEAPLANFSWTFSQQAPHGLGKPCDEFLYRPTPFGTNNPQVPAPAPAGPYKTSLDAFNGEQANGDWSLYASDNFGGDVGAIAGGWTITITTEDVDTAIPATGTSGPAGPYPATTAIVSDKVVITDLEVRVRGIWHERLGDLDVLLVGPRGQKVVLMANACGSREAAGLTWVWDDEAPTRMPTGGRDTDCQESRYQPTDREPGQRFPSPAPAGPYASELSAFDLTDPSGEWRLYVNDDDPDKVGFFDQRFEVLMSTRPKAAVAFADSAVQVAEGTTGALTLRRSAAGGLGAGRVTLTSLPATATSGSDFTPISTDVQFAAGERERTIQVDALSDGVEERDESYVVTIGSPSGDAAVTAPASVAVTIPAPAPAATAPGGGSGTGTDSAATGGPATGGTGTAGPGLADQPITVADNLAPSISRFVLAPKRFRAARGSRMRFALSERASVGVVIERAQRGRRWRRVTELARADVPAGLNAIPLSGRVGKRVLAVGAYRATIVATDSAGNRSTTTRASFRIVRR